MSTSEEYQQALQAVLQALETLPLDDQIRLLEEVFAIIRSERPSVEEEREHDIMEFEGVGAEHWRSIDVDKYIAEERASWDE